MLRTLLARLLAERQLRRAAARAGLAADAAAAHPGRPAGGGGAAGRAALAPARITGRCAAARLGGTMMPDRPAAAAAARTRAPAQRGTAGQCKLAACPRAGPRAPAPTGDSPDRFINRELSWLDFNHRVVEEAQNARHPLLERLRFISISASNLDEFYSVRVAGLIGQAKAGVGTLSADGRTPAQQLGEIQVRAAALMATQQTVWIELRGLLDAAGIGVCDPAALPRADRDWLAAWFMDRVFPVLTPLAIDPAHPFPFIPNMGLVMVLKLHRDEDNHA